MATSKKEASIAGKDLRDPKTPKKDRGPIASALAQAKHKPKKKGKWPMGTKAAVEGYCVSALRSTSAEEKLDYLARAIAELADFVDDIENDVRRIKRATSS
jgi:outer membrane murein-binding lipoprotein Lpp